MAVEEPLVAVCVNGAPSMPQTANTVTTNAATATPLATAIRRVGENGSSQCPANPAVTMKPMIIITQTKVAAAGRRRASVRLASNTSNVVPQAPTPTPIKVNATMASKMPANVLLAIQAVAQAASTPPLARIAMPPMIQGVRRPPTSEPKPSRGRNICRP